jgi:hypothetical protein
VVSVDVLGEQAATTNPSAATSTKGLVNLIY